MRPMVRLKADPTYVALEYVASSFSRTVVASDSKSTLQNVVWTFRSAPLAGLKGLHYI